MRKNYMKNGFAMLVVLAMVCVALLVPSIIYASAFENGETGYQALIVDEADLLSSSEEADLLEEMEGITGYTNIAFVSVDENYSSTENLAMRLNEEYFGNESGIVFIIDMDNRYIWIDSMCGARKTITDDYGQTITDNVYSYASDEDYYKCASKAFAQIHSLFEGQWIAQPMKYICNAFLAVALALLINYFMILNVSINIFASFKVSNVPMK